MNTFGRYFRVTTWGESHGPAIGAVIDGCPPGLPLEAEEIQRELDRRKPGSSPLTSQRKEQDTVQILSGVFEGRTLGTPISLVIWNRDQRSADYSKLAGVYRPGHADYTYQRKYGRRDYRGGGRSSGRETAGRVAAGAVARKLLVGRGIHVLAFARAIGEVSLSDEEVGQLIGGDAPADAEALRERIYASQVRCPHPRAETAMQEAIRGVAEEKDSLGGVVEVRAYGVPVGLGEPVFHKLGARLGQAVLSVGAVKGIEFGDGFRLAGMRGSQANDLFARTPAGGVAPASNHAGGMAGGISTGLPLVCRAVVKPTSSIGRRQKTVDAQGQPVSLEVEGRHDPCIVLRVVPVIEHMVGLVLLDLLMVHGALRQQQGGGTDG
jgi:chorismate synthase